MMSYDGTREGFFAFVRITSTYGLSNNGRVHLIVLYVPYK